MKIFKFCFIFQIGKHYANVTNGIQVFKLKKQHMTRLKYIITISRIGGIFPTFGGNFPKKNGNLWFFPFLILEIIIKMFQTLFECLNWKQHMTRLKYIITISQIGECFPHLGEIFPTEREIPQYNLAHKPATLATQTTLMLSEWKFSV